MTAKEYLSEILKYRRAMRSLQEQAEALRIELAGLKAITYDKDRVQVTPTNKIEELMPRLIDIEERYGEMIFKYHTAILVRTEQINSLESNHAKILTLRYVECKRWEQIAIELHYSYRNTTRLHGKALAAFARKYKRVLECPI